MPPANLMTRDLIGVLPMTATVGKAMGVQRSYPTAATVSARQVNGRIVPLSVSQRAMLSRDGYQCSHKFFFFKDPQLTLGTRLRFPDNPAGKIYRIVPPWDPDSQGRFWTLFGLLHSEDNPTLGEPTSGNVYS